jgi:hypothetical protein
MKALRAASRPLRVAAQLPRFFLDVSQEVENQRSVDLLKANL